MADPDVENLFRRFAATGDPQAIAEVYDRVAPELLLLAAHFGAKADDAEDILQATFLAAIESVHTFDSTRRFMPWLVGILVNQVHRVRRTRAKAQSIDGARFEFPAEPEPQDAAAAAELAVELARRLDALPPHYQQVLTLRWLHGLQPLEIAHALGLPPDTVKTRLRRGQDILRQVLPAGFAATGLLAASPRGLAAVREVIVRAAESAEAGRVSATASVPSRAGIGKLAVAAGVLVPVVATVAMLLRGGGEMDAPSSTEQTARAVVESASPPVGDESSGTVRAVLPTSPPIAEPIAAQSLAVRFSDGSPGAGVAVRATRRGTPDPLLCERWEVASDAGELRFDALEPGAWTFDADRGGRIECEVAAAGNPSATLVVPPGIEVFGRVTDSDSPVSDAGVWVSRDDARDEGHVAARTSSDGTFSLRSVSPGRSIGVIARGHAPRPIEPVGGIPGERKEWNVDLSTLKSAFTLAGRVVDEDGRPVFGARVQVGDKLAFLDFTKHATTRLERTAPAIVETDANGAFEIDGPPIYFKKARVHARAPGFYLARAEVEFDSNREEVTLTLPRGHALSGKVADASGAPLRNVRIRARDPSVRDYNVAPRWAETVAFSDGGGNFRLEGLASGLAWLTALAPGGERASADVTIVEGEDGARWDPELRAPGAIAGAVLDEDLHPLPGLLVRALVPPGRIEPRSVKTDERGRFAIDGCEHFAHVLWISDPGSPWNGCLGSRVGVLPAAGSPNEAREGETILVPREYLGSAAIVGRIVDPEGHPLAARVRIEGLRRGTADRNVDATGILKYEHVPPLNSGYVLYAETVNGCVIARSGIQPTPGGTVDLGDLVARQGGRLEVTLHRPDGSLVEEPVVVLVALPDGAQVDWIDVAGGEGSRDGLMPGRYLLHVRSEDSALTPTVVEVRSAETTRLPLVVERGVPVVVKAEHADDGWDATVDVDWCDANGALLCRERVRWPRGTPFPLRQALSPGSYRVRATSHAGLHAEALFDVPATAADPPVVQLLFR